jgi:hypothetical protein
LEKTGGNLLLVAPLNDAANDLLHKINEEFK